MNRPAQRLWVDAAFGRPEDGTCRWHEMIYMMKQACFQGYPESTECFQILIDPWSSATHNAYQTSLRPSLFVARPLLLTLCGLLGRPAASKEIMPDEAVPKL